MDARVLAEQAADLISREDRWSRHFTARGPIVVAGKVVEADKDCAVLATDPYARQWSALGALFKIGRAAKMSNEDIYAAERGICSSLGWERLSDWNSAVGHKAVVSGLRQFAEAVS